MNTEEEQNTQTGFGQLKVLAASLVLLGFLAGFILGGQINKYPSEAVDAPETTEFIIEETTVPVDVTEASVETEPATEPVIETTVAVVEETMAVEETTAPVQTIEVVAERFESSAEEVPETTCEAVRRAENLDLLACVIYQEAGGNGSCDDCRRRVADVVLNRVGSEHYPNSIYEVLVQPYQYGLMYKTGVVWPDRASSASEAAAVGRAYRIAGEVLDGQHSELYGKGYLYQAEFVQGRDNIYCCGHYYGR